MAWLLFSLVVIVAAAVGWRGTRARIAVVVGLVVAWLTASTVILTDGRNAGDFMGCWPACTRLQDTVGFVFFAGPVVLACVVLASLAAAFFKYQDAN